MADVERKIFKRKSDAGTCVFDTTYFPLLFLKWHATADVSLVTQHLNDRKPLVDYAQAQGIKVVMIVDISSMSVPNATQRKQIGDLVAAGDAGYDCLHLYIQVVSNAIMRGVITAISWMLGGKGVTSRPVDSIETAIGLATKELESLNVAFPPPPRTYKFVDYT